VVVERARWLQLFAATLVGSMNSSGGRGARNPFDREECVRSRGADNCSLPFARSENRKGQRSDA